MWASGYFIPGSPEHYLAVILLSVVLVIGSVANTLLLLAVYRTGYLKGRTSALILICLCSSDLYITVVSIPIYLTTAFSGHWLLGDLGCKMTAFIENSVSFVGLWCVCLSSIDRYIAVSKPLTYRKAMSRRRVQLALVILSLISMTLSTLPLVGFSSYSYKPNAFWCSIQDSGAPFINQIIQFDGYNETLGQIPLRSNYTIQTNISNHRRHVLFLLLYGVAYILLPLMLSVVSYIGIFATARSLRKREMVRKKMIEHINLRTTMYDAKYQYHSQLQPSCESGIEMDSLSTTREENSRDKELEDTFESTISRIPEARKRSFRSIRFSVNSSDTMLLETLRSNSFFSSTLIEDLNKTHEDYFSDSLLEPAETIVITDDDNTESSSDEDDQSQQAYTKTHNRVEQKPMLKKIYRFSLRGMSKTEILQLKTGVLLIVVSVVFMGCYLPSLFLSVVSSFRTDRHASTTQLVYILPFFTSAINPFVFGFLNYTLRTNTLKLFRIKGTTTTSKSPVNGTRCNSRRPSTNVRKNSLATVRRWGRRISRSMEVAIKGVNKTADDSADDCRLSVQTDLLSMEGASKHSVMSNMSILKDHITLKYFETNL